ncbi:uncharacterized protein MKK02DRAFT_45698 [Dioszegia hungarica]|uniref:Uncharacterized protein n=1 Tax=Dioszegia hungarica TaxID=4972 RepID=A0AA38LWQ0_9TREE|nr:uncharacterized protein MKK02DRAFT_45698 [Dioszegia hungarica]KAI9636989.1 hypothetical protein MKK02DRAFT_45698 [Dioszegia hungarica]
MQNPFYSAPPPSSSSAPPPSYSLRPAPPARPAATEPAQYSSLADLTKNKPVPPPRPGSGFSYTPDSARQGYSSAFAASGGSGSGSGPGNGQGGQAQHGGGYDPTRGDGRRMPPPPGNHGVGIPSEPPRRVVNAQPAAGAPALPNQPRPATGPASYLPASAQGYASTASSYATAGLGRAKEGLDSMMTQQRREQVTSNLGKAAAGGAKLLGQGAWKLGKFAANPSGK